MTTKLVNVKPTTPQVVFLDWISSYMIENLWRRLQSLDFVGIKDNWKIVCQNILIFQALKAALNNGFCQS